MGAMLSGSYEVIEKRNVNDIIEELRTIIKRIKKENDFIERLHFHFSGHGGYFVMNPGDNHMDSKILSVIGYQGEVFGINQIKVELIKANAKIVVLTLDNCRVYPGKKVTLLTEPPPKIPPPYKERMMTIYGTELGYKAKDGDSFTRRLYKVYDTDSERKPILLTEIDGKINELWRSKNKTEQDSSDSTNLIPTSDYTKGPIWDDVYWPA